MNKEITKNREALIRHLYSLPEPNRKSYSNYGIEGETACLCVKGQVMKKFFGVVKGKDYSCIGHPDTMSLNYRNRDFDGDKVPIEIQGFLNMSGSEWRTMEVLYERGLYNYSQIASWLQTLPGWPRIL